MLLMLQANSTKLQRNKSLYQEYFKNGRFSHHNHLRLPCYQNWIQFSSVAQSCLTLYQNWIQFSSVAQSCPTLCDPMNRSTPGLPVHHQLPGVHSDSRPSSRWCHPAISSSVVPFSSCPQSLPASESFPMSQLFTWGGQSIGVSALASFLPKNTQDWSSLEWTGWIRILLKRKLYLFLTEKPKF